MEKYFPSQMEKLSHSCRKEKGRPCRFFCCLHRWCLVFCIFAPYFLRQKNENQQKKNSIISNALILTDCITLSYQIGVSESIYTVKLTEYQGTPCLKQARHLKFN